MRFLIPTMGVILLVAALGWQFTLKNRQAQRFPDDWKWEFTSVLYTDIETGSFIDEEYLGTQLNPISTAKRTYAVGATDPAAPASVVSIDHTTLVTNIVTNATIWDFSTSFKVDAKTGRSYREDDDSYFFFPAGLEKKDYTISTSTHSGLLFSFVQEENLFGLDTYVFVYRGQIDDSLFYESVGLATPGHVVICYEAEIMFWAEPQTGEIIKFTEDCAGDYLIDEASGEELLTLLRWRNETSGDDLLRRLDEVKGMVRQRQLVEQYIPLALLLGGLGLAGWGGVLHFRSSAVVTATSQKDV